MLGMKSAISRDADLKSMGLLGGIRPSIDSFDIAFGQRVGTASHVRGLWGGTVGERGDRFQHEVLQPEITLTY
jgi:hypothetical protein